MQPTAPWATSACGARGEELVHRAALVGLDMAERDPAQPLDGHDPGDRLGHEREHGPRSGVEQQRFVGGDEELVEREPGRRSHVGYPGREPVDAVGDLVDGGGHQNGTSWVSRPEPHLPARVDAAELDGVEAQVVAIVALNEWPHPGSPAADQAASPI